MFIEMKKGVKKYGETDAAVYALNGAEFSVEKGEICVILGPSGSGKSTLLNMVGGLDRLDSGELIINGNNMEGQKNTQLTEYRRENIGFIFQFYNLIPDLTVLENVEVVADIAKNPLPIDEILKALEIEEFMYRFPKELSGGQQQRVAIARAIIKNPSLLLCDELTGALDSKSSLNVLEFVEKINQKYGTTTLIITHNESIKQMADRIVLLKDGKVVENKKNSNKITVKELEI